MMCGVDPEIMEKAAAWRARLAESTDLDTGEFYSWLAQDPRHREAWRRVQSPWNVLGEQAASPAVIRLRQAALAHAHDAIRSKWLWPRRFRRPLLLAAAAGIPLAAGAFLFWQQPQVIRTGFGERRVVMLADGSQVTLDSRSEVVVHYTADARALTLVRGQAQFDVTHDVARPFAVTADDHKVVATGTAFDVDLLGSNLLVTLLRGHVVVLPSRGAASTARLRGLTAGSGAAGQVDLGPGQQLVISSEGSPEVTQVDVERVTAWKQGELVFDNERLAEVIRRMNRYGRRHIVVGDDRAADLRISGAFHEDDVDGFVSTIAAYFPVRAHETPDGGVVLTYHSSGNDHVVVP